MILLDPGHGGHKGASVDGVYESNIVWDVAQIIAGIFPRLTVLSRDSASECPTFAERAAVADAHDVNMVLSLHCNTSPEASHQGAITFVQSDDDPHKTFAANIRRALPEEFRRAKNDHILAPQRYPKGHPKEWLNRPYAVVSAYRQPAVLLEMCYLTNPQDLAAIQREIVQSQVALACAVAIGELVAAARLEAGPVAAGNRSTPA